MPTLPHSFVSWLLAWPLALAAAPSPDLPDVDLKHVVSIARTSDARAPLLDLADEELLRWLECDAGALGSLSIGTPGGARLFNAVALPEYSRWRIAPGAITWATAETVEAVKTAVDTVHDLFPDTPPIFIGDISDSEGGRLKRHESHQAGRDVDFGFYYVDGKAAWYAPGSAKNLDLPRNWALVRALVTRTDVEKILLDTRIQRALYRHALEIGEEKAWLDRVFQVGKGLANAKVLHVPRHRTHYHVRFFNPIAQELGRRTHPLLVQLRLMEPPVYTVRHVVRPGQTLGHLARRYGVSTRAIMQANGLRSTRLRAGRAYRIPLRAAAPPSEPLVLPERVLPTITPPDMSAIAWPTAESLYGTVESSK